MVRKQGSLSKSRRQQVLVIGILVLALYVVVPQFGDFKSSWGLLRQPDWLWVWAAIGFISVTYMAAALTYCLLAFRKLQYAVTVLVQLAAMFVNRLLPAGVGAVGINFVYLRRQRHTATQAGTVVAINNLLGFAGHGIIVFVTLTFFASNINHVANENVSSRYIWLALAVATVIAMVTVFVVVGRNTFMRGVKDILKQLFSYRHRLQNLFAALGSSMLLTLCNVACLACCMLALDVQLSFATVLLVFTLGVGAGTATPTPGGLGGFEAGLVAGFVAYGVESSAALAIALLFRLLSYWLSMAAGAIAFVLCQRRQLLTL